MAYSFDQVFAADPSNPANVARNAAVTIFAPGDVAKTPLTLTTPNGDPLPNPLQVNNNGFGSAFMHATLDRVAWAGGNFTGFFTSYEGMKEEAVAARGAAQSAASSAGAEAAAAANAAVSSVVADAGAAAVNAATAASDAAASATAATNAAALVGAPADSAIAAAVNGAGATRTALNNTITAQTAPIAATVATKADTAALSSPVPGYVPFVERTQGGYATGSASVIMSNGTDTAAASRLMHTAVTDGTNVRLFFGNFSGAANGTHPITIQAVLESPVDAVTLSTVATPVYPVLFNGQATATIQATGIGVWSDPIPMRVRKGQRIYSRTLVTVSAGGKWPENLTTQTYNGEGAVRGAGATASLLVAGTSVPTNTITTYGPSVIVALPNAGTSPRTIGIIGDSIAAGLGESGPDVGYFVRAATANSVAIVNVARPGELALDFQGLGKRNRTAVVTPASDIIYEYGRNDLSNSQTLAQIQANLISDWQFFAAMGKVVRQTTITPYSTSTDAWITTGSQTSGNANAIRLQLNAWIRDGAPIHATTAAPLTVGATTNAIRAGSATHPLRAYIEITDIIETARDSGIWKGAKKPLADAAMTSGSNILTSASAAFVSGDVNSGVVVRGAGPGGADLLARLSAVTNGTTATLNASAGTTVTGAQAGVGVRTFDGLHPNVTGHVEIAAGLNLATILAS